MRKLGFKGYVNTDTGAVADKAWGVEHLSLEERIAKAIEAGSNISSGQKRSTTHYKCSKARFGK